MKEDLRFNCLDVLKAPALALSLQKIGVAFPPLLAGCAVYLLFSCLASAASNVPWESRACLCLPVGLNVWGWLLWAVGAAACLAAVLYAATAVARACFLELKGETFFTYRELYAFATRHAKSVLLGPLGIFAVIVGIVICGLVVGLIGRIPGVGVIVAVGLSPLWLGIAFFLVVLVVVLAFSVLLAPAVTATTRGDFFEVITETFSIAFSQLYRMIFYQFILGVVGSIAVLILGGLTCMAYHTMCWILSLGMGADFATVQTHAGTVLARWLPMAGAMPAEAVSGWLGFWGYVLAVVAALAFFLSVVCFATAVAAAGNTLIYVVLHKIKDEEDLLDIEEDEEEEEEAPAAAPDAETPATDATAAGAAAADAAPGAAGPTAPESGSCCTCSEPHGDTPCGQESATASQPEKPPDEGENKA